jgi:hypothetical protein
MFYLPRRIKPPYPKLLNILPDATKIYVPATLRAVANSLDRGLSELTVTELIRLLQGDHYLYGHRLSVVSKLLE